jgi:transcriptional regulator with XRE-family HTH domain
MEIKDWIREARKHAKLTQDRLAERLGLTKSNISAWEHGRHVASLDQLIRVASITGYMEPLPGLTHCFQTPDPCWPFRVVSANKVKALSTTELIQLETALLLSAAQLGLDVRVAEDNGNT